MHPAVNIEANAADTSRKSMAILSDLPPELLERIITFIDDQSDVWRLSRTCSSLSRLCDQFLRRSFANLHENHHDPTSLELQKLVRSIRATPALAKLITTVEVRSLRMSSFIWLLDSISAIKRFSYIHTFSADDSHKHRLYMCTCSHSQLPGFYLCCPTDHFITLLRSRHHTSLESLTLSILTESSQTKSYEWLEQQFWGIPHVPSLDTFEKLNDLIMDQTYLIATVGRHDHTNGTRPLKDLWDKRVTTAREHR